MICVYILSYHVRAERQGGHGGTSSRCLCADYHTSTSLGSRRKRGLGGGDGWMASMMMIMTMLVVVVVVVVMVD